MSAESVKWGIWLFLGLAMGGAASMEDAGSGVRRLVDSFAMNWTEDVCSENTGLRAFSPFHAEMV